MVDQRRRTSYPQGRRPGPPQSAGARFYDLVTGQAKKGYYRPEEEERDLRMENIRSIMRAREAQKPIDPWKLLQREETEKGWERVKRMEEVRERERVRKEAERQKEVADQERIIQYNFENVYKTPEEAEKDLIIGGRDPADYAGKIEALAPPTPTPFGQKIRKFFFPQDFEQKAPIGVTPEAQPSLPVRTKKAPNQKRLKASAYLRKQGIDTSEETITKFLKQNPTFK